MKFFLNHFNFFNIKFIHIQHEKILRWKPVQKKLLIYLVLAIRPYQHQSEKSIDVYIQYVSVRPNVFAFTQRFAMQLRTSKWSMLIAART